MFKSIPIPTTTALAVIASMATADSGDVANTPDGEFPAPYHPSKFPDLI